MKGLPIIEGWEYTGEWRKAKDGEGYINSANIFSVWNERGCTSAGKYPILHRKRWRAESGEHYYYLDTYLEVYKSREDFYVADCLRYQVGNYFQTKKEAEQARKRVIDALKGEE